MNDVLDTVPDRAMAVFAHPADAEIACGATLARWASQGCAVALVICTSGDKGSHDLGADPSRVTAARVVEAERAARALGVSPPEMLGHPDGEVVNSTAVRRRLVELIRAWRPDVVFGHDPTAVFIGSGYVNHRDHREVGFALVDAVAPAAGSPLYFPDTGPPHRVATLLLSGTLQVDTWVDVSGHLETKAAALRCHASQLGDDVEGVGLLVEQRAGEGAERSGRPHTEGFRRVSVGP